MYHGGLAGPEEPRGWTLLGKTPREVLVGDNASRRRARACRANSKRGQCFGRAKARISSSANHRWWRFLRRSVVAQRSGPSRPGAGSGCIPALDRGRRRRRGGSSGTLESPARPGAPTGDRGLARPGRAPGQEAGCSRHRTQYHARYGTRRLSSFPPSLPSTPSLTARPARLLPLCPVCARMIRRPAHSVTFGKPQLGESRPSGRHCAPPCSQCNHRSDRSSNGFPGSIQGPVPQAGRGAEPHPPCPYPPSIWRAITRR
jgi:hypothetical protein